jgi:nuclear transport factor 2 (NTF2) superfamily protein
MTSDSWASGCVRIAENAYNAGDLEGILALFTPECVFFENGKMVGQGEAVLRAWHEKFLASVANFEIRKRLRLTEGNVIGVDYATSFTHPRSGEAMESFGGEFWTMDGNRLREWHLYWSAYPA